MENETIKSDKSAKKSRRDFLIKGAKVAPVITAVAAAPVWATSNANSGNQSGGMSQSSRIVKFNGFSPGYFHEHKSGKRKNPTRRYNRYKRKVSTTNALTLKEVANFPVGTMICTTEELVAYSRILV